MSLFLSVFFRVFFLLYVMPVVKRIFRHWSWIFNKSCPLDNHLCSSLHNALNGPHSSYLIRLYNWRPCCLHITKRNAHASKELFFLRKIDCDWLIFYFLFLYRKICPIKMFLTEIPCNECKLSWPPKAYHSGKTRKALKFNYFVNYGVSLRFFCWQRCVWRLWYEYKCAKGTNLYWMFILLFKSRGSQSRKCLTPTLTVSDSAQEP